MCNCDLNTRATFEQFVTSARSGFPRSPQIPETEVRAELKNCKPNSNTDVVNIHRSVLCEILRTYSDVCHGRTHSLTDLHQQQ